MGSLLSKFRFKPSDDRDKKRIKFDKPVFNLKPFCVKKCDLWECEPSSELNLESPKVENAPLNLVAKVKEEMDKYTFVDYPKTENIPEKGSSNTTRACVRGN